MHVVSQIEGQEICILEDCSGARILKKKHVFACNVFAFFLVWPIKHAAINKWEFTDCYNNSNQNKILIKLQ